jgi:hypothetical protein
MTAFNDACSFSAADAPFKCTDVVGASGLGCCDQVPLAGCMSECYTLLTVGMHAYATVCRLFFIAGGTLPGWLSWVCFACWCQVTASVLLHGSLLPLLGHCPAVDCYGWSLQLLRLPD